MTEIETQRFYIYSSPYLFQVPVRRVKWEKLSYDERTLYYSARADISATGWTVPKLLGIDPKVTAIVKGGKIIGFSHTIFRDIYKDRKVHVIAVLGPLESLSIDERLEGHP